MPASFYDAAGDTSQLWPCPPSETALPSYRGYDYLAEPLAGQGAVLQVGLNESLGSPYGIRAVFGIGATRDDESISTGVPLGLLLPYCDRDQDAMPSVGYFDDARYAVHGDPGPKFTSLVDSANHDYYNTYWDEDIFAPGSEDDWAEDFFDRDTYCNAPGNGRLTGNEQHGLLLLRTPRLRGNAGRAAHGPTGDARRSLIRLLSLRYSG